MFDEIKPAKFEVDGYSVNFQTQGKYVTISFKSVLGRGIPVDISRSAKTVVNALELFDKENPNFTQDCLIFQGYDKLVFKYKKILGIYSKLKAFHIYDTLFFYYHKLFN